MAFEAVAFPQDLFTYTMKELCNMGGDVWGYGEEEKKGRGWLDEVLHASSWDMNTSSLPAPEPASADQAPPAATAPGRRKRRRAKKCKNRDEVESQRMTHIAVERNRRKQMNEYLSMLRSLMPPSYAQRGDQASIIGGAINYVKELEHLLQSLEAQKQTKQTPEMAAASIPPFTDFFTFPQYSSSSTNYSSNAAENASEVMTLPENRSSVADIEVTMVESHASLKVLTRRQPKQLLKMVVGLHSLRLATLHLNVSTAEQMVLYSLSLKMEEDCQFSSVDEIAAAVHRIVEKIQEEACVN